MVGDGMDRQSDALIQEPLRVQHFVGSGGRAPRGRCAGQQTERLADDKAHKSGPPERAALAKLQELGLRDVVRDRWPTERVFTYWDYRAGMFHQDLGMRIDLALATAAVASRVRAAWVDRQARKGRGPSDHAPVIVDLDEAPDGDIGPVVPPPSAPAARRGSARLPQAP